MAEDFMYKIHEIRNDKILAIADSSIVGKTLEDERMQISVKQEFYHEKKCGEKKALELVEESTIINAVGNNITSLLLRKNIVDKEKILHISGVAHAQIIKM